MVVVEIELEDLSTRKTGGDPTVVLTAEEDNTVVYWTWLSASILLVFSLCLILFPRLLLFLAETFETRNALTPLESYLAVHFAIWLATISVTLVLNIPSSFAAIPPRSSQTSSATHPLLWPLTVASGLSALLSYNTKDVGPLSSIVTVGMGIMNIWGFWVIVFAGPPLLSKTTGSDKRTSAFLFGNSSAASVQKKEWKKRNQ